MLTVFFVCLFLFSLTGIGSLWAGSSGWASGWASGAGVSGINSGTEEWIEEGDGLEVLGRRQFCALRVPPLTPSSLSVINLLDSDWVIPGSVLAKQKPAALRWCLRAVGMPCLDSLGRLDMEVRCHQANNKQIARFDRLISDFLHWVIGSEILPYVSVGYTTPVI